MKFNLEQFKAGTPAMTRDGRKAEFVVICEKCEDDVKLIAHIEGNRHISEFNILGKHNFTEKSDLVLMVSPHEDWEIDKNIFVGNTEDDCTLPRHFAGICKETGRVLVWDFGGTSHTTEYKTSWNYAKPAQKLKQAIDNQ